MHFKDTFQIKKAHNINQGSLIGTRFIINKQICFENQPCKMPHVPLFLKIFLVMLNVKYELTKLSTSAVYYNQRT